MSPNPNIKAVLFDIGGVVLGSPIVGAQRYEVKYSLPSHYINVAITATGKTGSFQRLERGEINDMEAYYKEFGEEMSGHGIGGRNGERNREAYRTYCKKIGVVCPPLPMNLKVDGKELWSMMMAQAQEPDELVLNAITRIRESKRFVLAALTNNFLVPPLSGAPTRPSPSPESIAALPKHTLTKAQLLEQIVEANKNPYARGGSPNALKRMFDFYIESALEGVRKPDPAFFNVALKKIGLKPEECVFLDDIGLNLASARKMGFHTIRVVPDRSIEAVKELESILGISLFINESKL